MANMNYSVHVRVNQANEFEIARRRKLHRIGGHVSCWRRVLVQQQDSRGDACGAIEAGSVGRNSRASNRDAKGRPKSRRAYLTGLQERHRMPLMRGKGPTDGVARMYPS